MPTISELPAVSPATVAALRTVIGVEVVQEGPQGPAGADGAQGPQGERGPPGADGEQGPQGLQGLPGADGAPGADGQQGPQGERGPQGEQGIQGPPGADGADAVLNPVPYIAAPTVTNLRDAMIAAGMMLADDAPPATIPVNSVAPAVTGNSTIGSLLTCSQGTWTGTAPITYAYQWRADGVDISGATASTYTSTQAAGVSITCRVTATNSAGNASATSNAVVLTEAPAPGGAPTYGHVNVNAVLSNGDTVLASTADNTVANALHTDPATGLVYAEARMIRGGNSACGMSIYGNTVGTLSPEYHFGRWYGEPGASMQMVSGWSSVCYYNYGMTGDGSTQGPALDGSSPLTVIGMMAVNVTTRQVWVRVKVGTGAVGGWLGGGDPAAGTNPTFVLAGTGPIRFGANSSNPENTVEYLAPGSFVGSVPAGFASYG